MSPVAFCCGPRERTKHEGREGTSSYPAHRSPAEVALDASPSSSPSAEGPGSTRGKFSDTSPHAESGDRKWGLGPSGFCTGPWPESGQIPTPHPVTGLDTCPTLEAERQDTPISDTFQHLPQGCHSNGPCWHWNSKGIPLKWVRVRGETVEGRETNHNHWWLRWPDQLVSKSCIAETISKTSLSAPALWPA